VTPRVQALAGIPPEPTGRASSAANPARPAHAGAEVEMILIEERDDAIYFARVRDLGKLMSSRNLHMNKDVLESLADLVLALVGEEGSNGSGSRG
jgi:hypothetical protein